MTHYDLHTKNIMFEKIPKKHKYLNYNIGGNKLSIPNVGWALVLIDFGYSYFKYNGNEYGRELPLILKKEFRKDYDIMHSSSSVLGNYMFKLKLPIKGFMIELFEKIWNEHKNSVDKSGRPKIYLPLNINQIFKTISKYHLTTGFDNGINFNNEWNFKSKWFEYS